MSELPLTEIQLHSTAFRRMGQATARTGRTLYPPNDSQESTSDLTNTFDQLPESDNKGEDQGEGAGCPMSLNISSIPNRTTLFKEDVSLVGWVKERLRR